MPAVGSSSSSSRGRASTMEARSTTRRVPVDSSAVRWSRNRSSPNERDHLVDRLALARARIAGPRASAGWRTARPPAAGRPRSDQQHVLHRELGEQPAVLERPDHARRRPAPRAGTRPGSSPSSRTEPGLRRDQLPEMASSMVVLPEPLGPISPTMAPGSADRSTPSTAWTPPKDTSSSSTSSRAGPLGRHQLGSPATGAGGRSPAPRWPAVREPVAGGRSGVGPAPGAFHQPASTPVGDQVAEPVEELGQAAGEVEDEGQQPEPAGEELDGRGGPEDGRQAHQVDGARARPRRSSPARR